MHGSVLVTRLPLMDTLKPQSNGPSYTVIGYGDWYTAVVVDGCAVTFWYPPSPLLAVPNVTAHPPTASV